MSILTGLTIAGFVTAGVVLLLLVLAQKGRGSSPLFGGGSGHTVLGTRTAEALTWVTAATFGVFLALAVLLNRMLG